MPTNAEISAWLAQRGVQATPQNANIAARIMGADAIASRGATDQGAALDASGEINRLYDQLNTRSMGGSRSRGAAQPGTPGQGAGDPTPPQNPANSSRGAPDVPPGFETPTAADGGDSSTDPAGVAALAAITGIPLAAARAFLRSRGIGGAAPAAGGGGLPAVRGGGGPPAIPGGTGGGPLAPSGGPPAGGGAPTPLVGRPVPGAPPAAPLALPAPAPQLPPPAAALPPPAATGVPIPPRPAAPLPATSPTPEPGPLPPRPSPVQDEITARRLSPEAARAQQAQTPPGVVRGGAGRGRGRGGFIPGSRHSPINPNTRVM